MLIEGGGGDEGVPGVTGGGVVPALFTSPPPPQLETAAALANRMIVERYRVVTVFLLEHDVRGHPGGCQTDHFYHSGRTSTVKQGQILGEAMPKSFRSHEWQVFNLRRVELIQSAALHRG
jgi:hypothetical protein